MPPVITLAVVVRRLRALLNIAAVLAAVAVAVAFQWRFEAAESRRWWDAHTRDMIDLSRSLIADLGEARSALRDFDYSSDPSHLARSSAARDRFAADLAELRRLTPDNPPQQANLAAVSAGADALFGRLDAGDHVAIAPFEALRLLVGRVVDEESRLLRTRSAEMDEAAERVKVAGRWATVPAAALVVDMAARAAFAAAHRHRGRRIGGAR